MIRIHRECHVLPLLHAAGDLVVCTAGYNSLLEAMEGGAHVIAMPVQPDSDGEQFLLSSRLSRHYPIHVVNNDAELEPAIQRALGNDNIKRSIRQRRTLNFDGLLAARTIVLDLCKKAGRRRERLA
jgi:predicted glycosyltransferase